MSMHDPISDMLTVFAMRNVLIKQLLPCLLQKLKCNCKVLKDEGYIEDFTVSADAKPVLENSLKILCRSPCD